MDMTRRAFVGSAAAVGGGLLVTDVVAVGKGGDDPVAAHIMREATRLAKDCRSGRLRHETITAMATNFRLHAAHARAADLDASLAKVVGRRVDRSGRQAVIDTATSPTVMHAHHERLRELDLEFLDVPMADIPREQYEQALSRVVIGRGVTPALDQAAEVLDGLGARLAARNNDVAIVRVQDIYFYCSTLQMMCQMLKEVAAIVCAIAATGQVELAPVCAVMGVEAATACFLAWAIGC